MRAGRRSVTCKEPDWIGNTPPRRKACNKGNYRYQTHSHEKNNNEEMLAIKRKNRHATEYLSAFTLYPNLQKNMLLWTSMTLRTVVRSNWAGHSKLSYLRIKTCLLSKALSVKRLMLNLNISTLLKTFSFPWSAPRYSRKMRINYRQCLFMGSM